MTTFYLVRHAEPNWQLKEDRNLQGALRDYVPLTDRGIQQAESITIKTPFLTDCEMIISSPFTRSLQTAAIMNRNLGLPIHVESDLHEWVPDNFQVNAVEELLELTKDYYFHNGIVPTGENKLWETKESVCKRARNVFGKYLDKARVIVVCHGMLISILMGYGPDSVELGSVHELKVEG